MLVYSCFKVSLLSKIEPPDVIGGVLFNYMLVTRQNVTGGRPLVEGRFPLSQDDQGNFGFKLGYHDKCRFCGKGGGEPLLIRTTDAESFATSMGIEIAKLKTFKRVRMPFKHWLAMKLVGKKMYHRIINKEEVEEGI